MGKNQTDVALYARVSTIGRGQDPETQLRQLRQMANHRKWNVIHEYVDIGISGSTAARPELDRLWTACRAGEVDVVAVARFDRFARSSQHLLKALEEFQAINVEFVSMAEQVDTTTPMGRMVFTILSAVSEMERNVIIERVQAGVARAKAQGKHCGRPVVSIDVRPAVAMLEKGHGLKAVSTAMGVSRSTLRRRLEEQGHWPPVQNPKVQ